MSEDKKILQATATESVDAVLKLTRTIMEFESASFYGPDITAGEASRMALILIDNLSEDVKAVDGKLLSDLLEQVRAE